MGHWLDVCYYDHCASERRFVTSGRTVSPAGSHVPFYEADPSV
jgi:hypothetical protein